MTEKANQHFVPQFYFRYFSNNGKSICLLNRKNGQTVNSASIKGQASKKFFYGDSKIENTLSEIEGWFSCSLSKLRNSFNLSDCSYDDYILILQNIMLQKTRTVTARQKSKAMQDKLLQLHTECAINRDNNLDEKKKVEFREIAKRLEADPKQYQLMEMSTSVKIASELADLLPIILRNNTFKPFVFSDTPVIFINLLQRKIKHRGVLGIRSPGLIVLYPLSTKRCLMLIDENSYVIKKLQNGSIPIKNQKDINALNKLQMHNASKVVYFSDKKFSKYVSGLWIQEKSRLMQHEGRVSQNPGFYDTGEPTQSDIIYSFDRQLPYLPKLTFLDFDEIHDLNYKYDRSEIIV